MATDKFSSLNLRIWPHTKEKRVTIEALDKLRQINSSDVKVRFKKIAYFSPVRFFVGNNYSFFVGTTTKPIKYIVIKIMDKQLLFTSCFCEILCLSGHLNPYMTRGLALGQKKRVAVTTSGNFF